MTDRIYFLGIGGIGMSALARWFKAEGAEVAGYDRTPTELTRALTEEGIPVDHSGSIAQLPESLQKDLSTSHTKRWTLVWTPAIPPEFPLLKAFRVAGFSLLKRAEVLGSISRNRPLLAVAGTHGKTTTSSLLTHLLDFGGMGVDGFLGGIALGETTNLVVSHPKSEARWMVAEADEFDRSFLQLHPQKAVITSVDPDHLDIYGTHLEMLAAFREFGQQVAENGLLVHAEAWHTMMENGYGTSGATPEYYGTLQENETLEEKGWSAGYSHIGGSGGQATFTLHLRGETPMEIKWRLPGAHNAANATAAAHLAVRAGLPPNALPTALEAFPGVARRFEIKYQSADHVVIDDYAHHPSEIAGTIAAARQLFPGRRITGVFQPHLFSRTRDFMQDFAHSLSQLDTCILLPIYPARETPIQGVDAQGIGEKMVGCPVECPPENRFLDVLEKQDPEVLLFMGAGDLNQWIEPAWSRLENRRNQPPIETT